MNFKKLFTRSKNVGNYRRKNLWDFFMRFYESDREVINMRGYIWENQSCDDMSKFPTKKLFKRYTIDRSQSPLLAWYLLEQYFEGNIEIKVKQDDV